MLHVEPGSFLGSPLRTRHVEGLTLCESRYDAGLRLEKHAHASAFFCLTIAGGFTESYARRDADCTPASAAFHPPDEEHVVTVGRADVRCLNVDLDERWLRRLRDVSTELTPVVDRGGPLTWLAARLYAELRHWSPSSALAAEGLALEMMAATLRTQSPVAKEPPWLARVDELLRASFRDALRVGEIAAEIGVHPVHLARSYRRFRGTSLHERVQQLRIAFACERLARPARTPLADLALDAGFADQTHFSRVFKQVTGVTPGAFRKSFE